MNAQSGQYRASVVPRVLTRPPSRPFDGSVVRTGPDPAAGHQPAAPPTRTGLRGRLLFVDVAATVGTMFTLGILQLPGATADRRWGAATLASITTLTAMHLLGLYQSRRCARRAYEAARIMIAVLVGGGVLVLLHGSRGSVFIGAMTAVGSCAMALLVLRWAFRQWLRAQRTRGRFLRSLILVGTNEDAVAVWMMLHHEPELGYEVTAVIGDPPPHPPSMHLVSARTIAELPEVARRTAATGVLLVTNALTGKEVQQAIGLASSNGLHVQICPGFRGLGTRRVRHVPLSGETFLYVEPGRRSLWQLAVKRVIDVVGSSVGLLVTSPVLLLAALAIKLEDRGPILYRQERIGVNGRPFVVHKLRTMTSDHSYDLADLALLNERADGPLFKASHDPRVTRTGAVLRALSIDELPQLLEVLRGSMSLVGPRPALPQEVEQFDPDFHRRHTVKPGITGLWQLEARDNPSFHAYRRLDLLYVDNWSVALDISILLATLPAVAARAMTGFRQHPGN